MYHAIIAKDYKPLQKLPGFGVRLLPHTDGRKASLCGQAAAGLLQSRYLQVKMGSEVWWMGYISESSPEVQMGVPAVPRAPCLLLPPRWAVRP